MIKQVHSIIGSHVMHNWFCPADQQAHSLTSHLLTKCLTLVARHYLCSLNVYNSRVVLSYT